MKKIGYYIRLIILAPFWLICPDRKTWPEFKSGLIKHKCDFDGGEVQIEQYRGRLYGFRKCKHFGCNMVEPIE